MIDLHARPSWADSPHGRDPGVWIRIILAKLDVQSGVTEVLDLALSPLHDRHSFINAIEEIEIIDLLGCLDAISIDMDEIERMGTMPVDGWVMTRNDEGRTRHRTTHPEDVAQATNERRLPRPEFPRQDDEVSSSAHARHTSAEFLGGGHVRQQDRRACLSAHYY